MKIEISTHLAPPLFKDDFEFVFENAPDYLDSIRASLADGHAPDDIYRYYVRIAPHRQAFWLRLRHAAEYLLAEKAKESATK